MAESTSVIRSEFDRIALLAGDEEGWTHNNHYHNFLLRHFPRPCRHALEVGCGTGAFSRLMAARSERVLALDLSPEMIRIAREHSLSFSNIDYNVADAVERELPAEEFDCIATIATLHHLPLALMLSKMERALKPNGVILILDLFQPEGIRDVLTNAMAMPVSVGFRLLKRGQLRPPAAVRAVWAEHAEHDRFPTLSEVRKLCARLLPGASVRKHLLWRYSVVWKKVVV
jgi:ubiquinone/menaquinone biosynthesis C-methylase UbiE